MVRVVRLIVRGAGATLRPARCGSYIYACVVEVLGLGVPGQGPRAVHGQSPRFMLEGEGPKRMRGDGRMFRRAR